MKLKPSIPLLVAALSAGLITQSDAAISVSGVSDQSENGSGSSATVEVRSEAGFTTTALYNDAPFPLDTPMVIDGTGYHEIIETKLPDAGGAAVVDDFQFIIRAPGRASTEDGIPLFSPYPIVNDAPSAFEGLAIRLIAPTSYPLGMPLPIAAKLIDPANRNRVVWLNGQGTSEHFPAAAIGLLRGWGSTVLPAATAAGTNTYDLAVNQLHAIAHTVIETNTMWESKGGVLSSNETWLSGARIDLVATLQVSAGAELVIEAGVVVRLAESVGIEVLPGGKFTITGTVTNPVVFAPQSLDAPWGGIWLQEGDAQMAAEGVIFCSYGAAYDWFDTHPGFSSHRDEEACILVGDGANLVLTDAFLVDGRGQALHGDGGDMHLQRCLIHRATTAGEITRGEILIEQSAFLVFLDRPNGASNVYLDDTPGFVDGDNDGLYLQPRTGFTHALVDTVIGWSIDDGIDTGGSGGGTTVVSNCWFEAHYHEAMSHSGADRRPESYGTVFFANGQAFECGYDGPNSYMQDSLVIGNMVGARFGDNYDWNYPGSLEVRNSLLIENEFHDVWGFDWASWTYNFDKMTIASNKISNLADLGRHPGTGNSAWDPATDGHLLAPFMPVPESDVGVAMLIEGGSNPLSAYPTDGKIQLRLSTFSSREVTVDWSLLGKANMQAAGENLLASGTAVFSPGETIKEIDAPLAPNYELARVRLSNPVAAEVTGSDGWFLYVPEPPADQILVPLAATNWSYSAIRAEPSAGWKGLGYTEAPAEWQTNNTAPIGLGNISSANGNIVLGTSLSAVEAGPNTNRTRAVYFRRTFQVSNPDEIASLTLRVMRDDSIVIYVNGDELLRNNIDHPTIPGGPIEYALLSNATVAGDAEGQVNDLAVPANAPASLVVGTNVIAVEVHQASLTSSDLVMDLELAAQLKVPNVEQRLQTTKFSDGHFLFWNAAEMQLQQSMDLENWFDVPTPFSPQVVPADERKIYYRGRQR